MEDLALNLFAERVKPRPESVEPRTVAAEASLTEFSRQAWSVVRPGDPWVDGWVFGCLCEHYQALFEGQIRKLAVACPPRHGKSLGAGVFLPTWGWVRKPSTRYIFVSYMARLAERDSRYCRDVIKSLWFQDRWGHLFTFREDQNTQANFANSRGGFRIATTPGGWAVGEGADIVVADDITSVEDAFSPLALETAWRFWTQTMTMRFHDPENIKRAIVMQRTAKGDLIGRAIAEAAGYEVCTLPFEAEPARTYFLPAQRSELGMPPLPEGEDRPPENAIIPTSLQVKRPELMDPRTEEGQILWPERFRSAETIADLKRSVKAGAAGQLQQRPAAEAGVIFKPSKFRRFYPRWTPKGLSFVLGHLPDGRPAREVLAAECLWYQTVDTAQKIEQANDYTVVLTACKTPPPAQLLIYHVFRHRLMVPEQWPALCQLRAGQGAWDDSGRLFRVPGALRPWPRGLAFQAVESKNSGIGLLQLARSEGKALKELDADTNKVMRAAPVSTLYEGEQVWHNGEAEWVEDFEAELRDFPAAGHDDMVDTVAYAGILFIHDAILTRFTGDVVYNEGVLEEVARQHAEEERARIEAETAKALGIEPPPRWIPPSQRPATAEPAESIDAILAALQGKPPMRKPVVDDHGRLDPRFLADED